MVSKNPDTPVISSRDTYCRNCAFENQGLSDWDAYEINMQYNLNNHCKSRGMVWKFWDQKRGIPRKGKRDQDLDSCVGSKRARFAGCVNENPCESGFSCVDVVERPGYTGWFHKM